MWEKILLGWHLGTQLLTFLCMLKLMTKLCLVPAYLDYLHTCVKHQSFLPDFKGQKMPCNQTTTGALVPRSLMGMVPHFLLTECVP